jgi:hypothetical protein
MTSMTMPLCAERVLCNAVGREAVLQKRKITGVYFQVDWINYILAHAGQGETID